MRYVAQRVTYLVPTLFLVSIIIFFLMRILPGDVATLILMGPDGTGMPSQEDIARLNAELGLDRPLAVQYFDWIWGLLQLDAGNSLWTGRPVFSELGSRLPLSLELGIITSMLSLLIGVPLGVIAAVKRETPIDYVARIFAIGGLAVPNFWIGILLILALVTFFDWVPPLGYKGPLEDPQAHFQQMIWPALALGYSSSALIARLTRSSMLEVMREDYVRTARAKGLRNSTVITRHVLRNALLPVVTIVGISVAGITCSTVIMETVFSLPGVGRYMVTAITQRDYPVVQTLVFIFAIAYALANLLVDLSYMFLDPRIRLR